MKRVLFLTFALALTACTAQPIAPTTTSVPTATLTPVPTLTPTATLTPSPTPTSSPQPIPEGVISEFAEKIKGSYELHWKGGVIILVDAKTKQEVPEIVFDENGNWSRTYTLEYPTGTSEEITVKGTLDKIKFENIVDKIILGFSAWKIGDGKWIRKTVIYKDKETDIPLYSVKEMVSIILLETQKVKSASGGKLPEQYTVLTGDHISNLLGQKGSNIHLYQGMAFEKYLPPDRMNAKGYNRIYVRNSNTGQYDIDTFEYTTFYAYISLDKNNNDGEYGYLVIQSIEENLVFFIDEQKLNEHSVKEPNLFRTD